MQFQRQYIGIYNTFQQQNSGALVKKSRIRETLNLLTEADSRTDTILERLRDLSKKKIYIYIYIKKKYIPKYVCVQ